MRAVSGIFTRLSEGVDAAERLGPLVGVDNVNLLTPVPGGERPGEVPTTEDMAPVGGAMGGVIGGALGVATAMAIPGIGQVVVLGMAAAALLGAGGGVIGWTLGDAVDRASSTGLPVDELYVYENAIDQGRTVVIALVGDKEKEKEVREILDEAGAESLDAARHRWWGGLRDAEMEHYDAPDEEFARDESPFRMGFEAALSARTRGKSYAESLPFLRGQHPDAYAMPPFRRGFERGKKYLAARRARVTTRPASAVPSFPSAV